MTKTPHSQVAIITGAGSGIGKHASILLAQHGVKTFLIDFDSVSGQNTADHIMKSGGESFFEKVDVSQPDQLEKAVNKCIELYGGLDIGVNSAGIAGARELTHSYSISDWNKLIEINLTGVFISMKYQITKMVANGSGRIVNISSIAGIVGLPNASAYVAAKHGVIGITKTAALEYAKNGISINAISPDGVIEGIEDSRYNFCLGVQWHPEFEIDQGDAKLFRAFVKAAALYAKENTK